MTEVCNHTFSTVIHTNRSLETQNLHIASDSSLCESPRVSSNFIKMLKILTYSQNNYHQSYINKAWYGRAAIFIKPEKIQFLFFSNPLPFMRGSRKITQTGLLRFQNTSTTKFQKTSLTWETDYYSYKNLSDKNSGFKVRDKSGRVATLLRARYSSPKFDPENISVE